MPSCNLGRAESGAKKIIIAEKLENRIARIKKHTTCSVLDATLPLQEVIASETCKKSVDVILMATPDVVIDNSLLRLLAPGGRICIFSGPRAGDYEEMIDIRSMHYRELTMVGAYGCSSRQNREAVKLLASGALDVDWIITKRTNLENIVEAFDHSSERKGLKSVIDGA
jgi:L-iditol 2-dehydrogenase